MRVRSCLVALIVLMALTSAIPAQGIQSYQPPRQYYGEWKHNPAKKYYYRYYYYKPHPKYNGYKYHIVYWFYEKDPQYLYYYNPETKKFWARIPTRKNLQYKEQLLKGEELWAVLKKEDTTGDLNDAQKKFPKVGKDCPQIPESTDGAIVDMPPQDLPGDDE